MRFYLNEASANNLPNDKSQLNDIIVQFILACNALKVVGFSELRATIHPLNIELSPGYLLASWVKERNGNSQDAKTRFKNLMLNVPLYSNVESDEVLKAKASWCDFTYKGERTDGIGAAYLSNSISISFETANHWKDHKIDEVKFQFLADNSDSISEQMITTDNVSNETHIEFFKILVKNYSISKNIPEDWDPKDNLLPNIEYCKEHFKIEQFYKSFQGYDRGTKISESIKMGAKIAITNGYKQEEYLSKINSSRDKIRKIFSSQNRVGKKIYLSIDIEKGAFEVCDFQGVHQQEVLFNGEKNGAQKLDHSIILEKD